ncbi:MAG TPA: tryptophan synthase subunit alpha [Candidatus Dormibacteraeota bacterium]|jgi:tryptophan synthase alpha chain|nr:tryptophan synthase subunit alpha [Candidatus Dormibacteraeota bacterium]
MTVGTAGQNRLSHAFAQRDPGALPGLIPYITAGYPNRDDTVTLLAAAERAGCMAAEIGLPFSDPLADGPTIQRTSQQALHNGMSVNLALEQVAAARAQGIAMPLALMTYVNPVLSYGLDRFATDAAAAGADALILPDLPLDEAAQMRAAADAAGLALILLVAPTTPDARLQAACAHASGFVYCLSVTGITGARTEIAAEAIDLLTRVRRVTDLPRALGFGLSTHAHMQALRGRAEAAVVGSALLNAVAAQPQDPAGAAERFLRDMLGDTA